MENFRKTIKEFQVFEDFRPSGLVSLKNKDFPFLIYYDSGDVRFEEHWHDSFEIAYFIDGDGTFTIDSRDFQFKQGSLFFLSPFQKHYIRKKIRDFKFMGAIFNPTRFVDSFVTWNNISTVFSLLKNISRIDNHITSQAVHDSVIQLMERMFHVFKNKHMGYESYINGCIQQITYILLEEAHINPNEFKSFFKKNYEKVLNSMEYIKVHFRERISIDTLAGDNALSTSHFRKISKEVTGTTVLHFLTITRLQNASYLLLNTSKSIKEIYYLCGFSSSSHFCRKFKEYCAMTPNEFKQQYK